MKQIKLIVGLGNPGKDYQTHRHNAGFWFCDRLAHANDGVFKKEAKFFGEIAPVCIADLSLRLIKPIVYMNQSGQCVGRIARFYRAHVEEILIVHDELDLNPGVAKIKLGGGHGGHNGLNDIIKALDSRDFYRLRIGIGRPHSGEDAAAFVLHAPNKSEIQPIQSALTKAMGVIGLLVQGCTDDAMKTLHTQG